MKLDDEKENEAGLDELRNAIKKSGVAEEDVEYWLETIGCEMSKEVWGLLTTTDNQLILELANIVDIYVSKTTRFLQTNLSEIETKIDEQILIKLMNWFGINSQGILLIPRAIVENRLFVIRSLIHSGVIS